MKDMKSMKGQRTKLFMVPLVKFHGPRGLPNLPFRNQVPLQLLDKCPLRVFIITS